MPVEVTSLGLKVDTSDVIAANAALKTFADTAATVDTATQRMLASLKLYTDAAAQLRTATSQSQLGFSSLIGGGGFDFSQALAGTKSIEEALRSTTAANKEHEASWLDAGTAIKSALNEGEESLQNFRESLSGVEALLLIFGVGFSLKEIIQETAEHDTEVAKLQATLKATGNEFNFTVEGLQKQAKALAENTNYTHDQTLAVEDMLISFGRVSSGELPRATQAILDFAAKLGEDPVSAAHLLAKGLADPELAMFALRRAGILLTEQQRESLKQFEDTGNTAGSMAVILGLIEHQSGGTAKALNDTLGGSLINVQKAFKIFEEDIGKAGFADAFRSAADELTVFFSQSKDLATTIGGALASGVHILVAAFEELATHANTVKDIFVFYGTFKLAELFGGFAEAALNLGRALGIVALSAEEVELATIPLVAVLTLAGFAAYKFWESNQAPASVKDNYDAAAKSVTDLKGRITDLQQANQDLLSYKTTTPTAPESAPGGAIDETIAKNNQALTALQTQLRSATTESDRLSTSLQRLNAAAAIQATRDKITELTEEIRHYQDITKDLQAGKIGGPAAWKDDQINKNAEQVQNLTVQLAAANAELEKLNGEVARTPNFDFGKPLGAPTDRGRYANIDIPGLNPGGPEAQPARDVQRLLETLQQQNRVKQLTLDLTAQAADIDRKDFLTQTDKGRELQRQFEFQKLMAEHNLPEGTIGEDRLRSLSEQTALYQQLSKDAEAGSKMAEGTETEYTKQADTLREIARLSKTVVDQQTGQTAISPATAAIATQRAQESPYKGQTEAAQHAQEQLLELQTEYNVKVGTDGAGAWEQQVNSMKDAYAIQDALHKAQLDLNVALIPEGEQRDAIIRAQRTVISLTEQQLNAEHQLTDLKTSLKDWEDTRSAVEKFTETMSEANYQYQLFIQTQGQAGISADTWNRTLIKSQETLTQSSKYVGEFGSDVQTAMTSAAEAFLQGQKAAQALLSSMADLVKSIIKLILEATLLDPIKNAFKEWSSGEAGTGFGAVTKSLKDAFGNSPEGRLLGFGTQIPPGGPGSSTSTATGGANLLAKPPDPNSVLGLLSQPTSNLDTNTPLGQLLNTTLNQNQGGTNGPPLNAAAPLGTAANPTGSLNTATATLNVQTLNAANLVLNSSLPTSSTSSLSKLPTSPTSGTPVSTSSLGGAVNVTTMTVGTLTTTGGSINQGVNPYGGGGTGLTSADQTASQNFGTGLGNDPQTQAITQSGIETKLAIGSMAAGVVGSLGSLLGAVVGGSAGQIIQMTFMVAQLVLQTALLGFQLFLLATPKALVLGTGVWVGAKGGVMDGHAPGYAGGGTFTNTIVNSPTYFQSGGGLGLMGEAGPEAIMPLVSIGGQYGIRTSGGSVLPLAWTKSGHLGVDHQPATHHAYGALFASGGAFAGLNFGSEPTPSRQFNPAGAAPGSGDTTVIHLPNYSPVVSTINANGMQKLLKKHSNDLTDQVLTVIERKRPGVKALVKR